MPHFTQKRLIAAVLLVFAGIADIVIGVTTFPAEPLKLPFDIGGCWMIGGTMVGAGVLAPFKHEWVGAFIGFIIAAVWAAMMASIIWGISV